MFGGVRKSVAVLLRSVAVAWVATNPALAQDFFDIPAINLPSSITLEGGGDAAGARNLTVNADVGLQSGTRIRAGIAGARVDASDVHYAGNTSWAGVNSDPLAPFSYGANYEAMQRDDGIRSAALKANVRWHFNDWQVTAYPELRSITLTKTQVTRKNLVRTVETTLGSPGLGAAVTYSGVEAWSFAFRRFVYRYDTDAQTLRSHPAFAQLVTSQVDQSFDAARSGVNADYAPSWGSIGVEATRSESAIDHAAARSVAVNLSWDATRAWTAFAHVGRSHATGVAATGFASAGVTWMWDQ